MFTGMQWFRKSLMCLVLTVALSLAAVTASAADLPASNITDPLDGSALPASLGSYSIRGEAFDSGAGLQKVEVSFDGGSSWDATYDTSGNGSLSAWEYSWVPLPLGNYSIISRATDNLGSVEYPGPGTHVIIDGSSPTSYVTSPAAGSQIAGTTCVITGLADDGPGSGVVSVEVSIDGGANWSPASGTTSWSYVWTLPADGVYTILTRAADAATNLESPGTGVTVSVDNTPPLSAITSPVEGEYVRGSVYTVTGTAGDGSGSGVQTVEVAIDGGAWQPATGTGNWSYLWAVQADGSHTITVRATDAASNIETPGAGVAVVIDNTLPVSSVTDPVDGAAVNTDFYDIKGVADDGTGSGVVNVDVSVDGGQTWNSASDSSGNGTLSSWAFHWAPLPLGNHSITVRAADGVGNVETPSAGVHLLVDRTPPVSSVGFPVEGTILSGQSCTVTGTSTDNGGAGVDRVEVSTDGGITWSVAVGTGEWSYDWTIASDNGYTIMSRSVDTTGNAETPSEGVAVIVDNTPPASIITSPADGEYVAGSVYTITGTADDGAGSGVQAVEVSTDGGTSWSAAIGTDSWIFSWSVPADGTYTIQPRATDAASNVESPGAGVTVTADATPPASLVLYPAEGALLGGSAICTITGTATDGAGSGVSTVEVSTDGGLTWNITTGTTSWSYSWTLPEDGTYSIQSRATDNAGNEETPGTGVTVSVDTTPPTATITDPAAGALVGGATFYTVAGTADDGSGSGVTSVEVSTDGGITWSSATGTTSWSYSWTLPDDGSYTLMSKAADNAGNTETPGPGITVTVDTTPPTGSIELKGGRYTKARTVHLTLSARDTGSNCPEPDPVMCSIDMMQLSDDGVNWLAWEAPSTDVSWHFSKGDGEKSVFVHYRDLAGNVSEDYVATAIVDTVNPVSAVESPADGSVIIIPTTIISGTAGDSGSGVALVELSTDGGSSWEAATGTTSWTYQWTPVSDGSYNILSRSTDNAGNVENPGTGVTVTVSIDSTPPTGSVSINSGAQYANSTDVVLALTADDVGSSVSDMRISKDGVFDTEPWEPYEMARNITLAPGDGVKDVYVLYRDAAGNESTVCSDEITLDTVTPAGSVLIDGGAQFTHTTTVTLELDASDALSGVTQMQISEDGLFDTEPWEPYSNIRTWDLSAAEGAKAVYVRFMDAASNVSVTVSDDINLNYDTDPPSSSITAPSDGEYMSGVTYLVSGTASDTGTGVSKVEVSTDGGTVWLFASYSSGSWSYTWNIGSPGSHSIKSRAKDNAGNVETPGDGITVSVDAIGSPELAHFDWDAWLTGGDCTVCHAAISTFLSAGFRDEPGFCRSCHNAAAPAHDRNLMGTAEHALFTSVTTAGCRMPTYGNITSAKYDNRMFAHLMDGGKVVCVTCHNPMQKTEDMGRVWEYTTTSDELTYMLVNGGWAGYVNLAPIVYRNTGLWSGPSYVKDKKAYLVDPSEYTFNEYSGTVTFSQVQDPAAYIYVTLDYPYLRVSNAANTLCADCHAETTHMGVNCLTCHMAHNTDNLGGIREMVRTTERSEKAVVFDGISGVNSFADGDATYDGICEVCHTSTLYHKRDGSGSAHHGGEDCGSCHTHASGYANVVYHMD